MRIICEKDLTNLVRLIMDILKCKHLMLNLESTIHYNCVRTEKTHRDFLQIVNVAR